MTKPFLLGLTGSIGMGKTTTSALFAEAGVPVWDADAAVHRLYAAGGDAVGPVAALHPPALRDGAIDRDALRRWIARDKGALARIEQAVHPLLAADRAAFITAHEGADILLFDIPLLYETGAESWLDAVAVVSVAAGEQRRRVLARKTMTQDEFAAILAKQMPDAEKRARADWVIATDSPEHARAGVSEVIASIRSRRNA